MMNIAFYISSHGYGHAARQQAVIDALARRGAHVYVRTAAPPKFFKSAQDYHEQRYDIGMIQRDALHFDLDASVQWVLDFYAQQAAVIAAEVDFVRANAIQLIVSDMPPIACDIAHAAAIPSAVVTHFTWDWVYAHYLDAFPQLAAPIEQMRASYRRATLALQMQVPIPHRFDMFERVEPVGLIHNKATEARAVVRQRFNVPDGARMVLLSMGGHAWGSGDVRQLSAVEGCVFLVMPGAWEQVKQQPERFRPVPMDTDDYHNLIAAADLVVGKAGGSTVAEVIGHQTPMLYTSQGNWRESALLARTLHTFGAARHIPLDHFLRGQWISDLRDFLARTHRWPSLERDGAERAAERLLQLGRDGR